MCLFVIPIAVVRILVDVLVGVYWLSLPVMWVSLYVQMFAMSRIFIDAQKNI